MHMKVSSCKLHAKDYIRSLAASGRYCFLSSDARKALGVSADATKLALSRLARQKMIAQPARGFYVIVPPEYRSLGCLPADQFIPALMEQLNQPYYAGLLSAAQYHGAAHHRPQEFQVVLERARRPIACGQVRAKFIVRKRLRQVPVQSFKTPRGPIRASTPEATAVDLVGYCHRVGGLDQVATVLLELAEQIDPRKLPTAAKSAPITWAQRLGYLLDFAGARAPTHHLRAYVKAKARQTVPLLPGDNPRGIPTRCQLEDPCQRRYRARSVIPRDPQFNADIGPLLATGYTWNYEEAAEKVCSQLIARLTGLNWGGGDGLGGGNHSDEELGTEIRTHK